MNIKNYTNTDQKLHLLCQIIAKANRTFVPTKKDGSNTNLAYNMLKNRIEGRWIKASSGKIILSLNLSNFQFEWIDEQNTVLDSIHSIGFTMEKIENEIDKGLGNLGLHSDAFKEPMHYKIPKYSFLNDPISPISYDEIRLWKMFRGLANVACDNLMLSLKNTSEIRIWPHHFDTGIYLEPSTQIGIGFGLAMEDSLVAAPYFYFSGYGLNGYTIDYTNFQVLEIGKWIVEENWKGAVLPLHDLQGTKPDKVALFQEQASSCFL